MKDCELETSKTRHKRLFSWMSSLVTRAIQKRDNNRHDEFGSYLTIFKMVDNGAKEVGAKSKMYLNFNNLR